MTYNEMLYAVTANSAWAWTRSEFAEWVPRWHGRIASVGWRFFFRQIFARMNLLENLQIAKTRFPGLRINYGFPGFSHFGIFSIWVKQIYQNSSAPKTNFSVGILRNWNWISAIKFQNFSAKILSNSQNKFSCKSSKQTSKQILPNYFEQGCQLNSFAIITQIFG